MKKYVLYICVATLLISCSKDEVPPMTESGTMSFAAQLSNSEDDWSANSRGTVTTSGTITDFSAFGFRTGSLKWAENGHSTVPNKMFNQLVERKDNAWVYTPAVKWEGGDVSHFSFFGYSPYSTGTYDVASNPTGNNIEMVSDAATAGAPVISFAPLADLSSQIDLLVAKPVLDTRPVDYVAMNFTHALTQIRFKGWTDQPKTEITSIKIKGVVGKGSLNIGSTEWVAGSETAEYDYAFPALEVSTNKASMTDLSPGNNTFMLLPQDMTANATAVVQFTYTIDEVPLVKEYVLKENWKRNQAMTYTVNLTEADQPLDITVEVTPWVIGTGGVGDADVEIVLEEGSFIPNAVLLAAGWPADILPIEGGLQLAMRGNVLPGGTPAAKDPTMQWKTENSSTLGVDLADNFLRAEFGMGKISTDAMTIPSQIDLHPAAKACRAMGRGWYLPSIAELALINNNKSLLSAAYTFSADYYWSATEQMYSTAYLINTQSNTATTGKTSAQGVRCVKGTPPRAQVDVTPTLQADIPIDGGTYTVQLTSNYAWMASSTVSGVTFTPSSGVAGTNVSVVITVPANPTTSALTVPVVFITAGGGEIATTTWTGTQLALPLPTISTTPDAQVDIPVEGGTYTVQLTSNYAWSTNALPSGVTVTPSSGVAGTDVSVVITVPANPTTSALTVPVVFITAGSGETATTTWTGTQLAPPPPPAISVTPTVQADIPVEGGTYTVQLTSNYEWTVSSIVSGVTVTPLTREAGVNMSVKITVPANTATAARSVPVVFTTTSGGTTVSDTWTGTQLEVLPIEAYGILWATGNLVADGANGARIGAPTDCGLYFQFGSLIGWSGGTSGSGEGAPSAVTKSLLEVKPKAYSGMTTFYACGYYAGAAGSELPTTDDAAQGIGDPCRFYLGGSWRLPKLLEFQALCNGYAGGYNNLDLANVAWNNTYPKGMTFNNSSSSNQVYIPASGIRESLTAASYLNVDKNASLWTSETHSTNATSGMYMNLGSNFVLPLKTFINRTNGLSVRCVREI